MAKPASYDRIKARKDGRKPSTFKELWDRYGDNFGDAYITNIKFVVKGGSTTITWTEKDADEMNRMNGPLKDSPAAKEQANGG